MNVSYKRDMTHNYMVPETTENVSEDDYRVHMLMENHIQGLLPCCARRVNCQSRFFYDITSRQSMEHVYGNSRMRAEDIRKLLRGLYRALREIKKYLLDMDRIILEPNMIYMDIETREPLFCYLPGYQKDIMQSFRELTMYLLERIDDADQQAVLLGYEIYRRAREENYSLEKILQEAGAPEEVRELNNPSVSGHGGQILFAGQSAGGRQTPFAGQDAGGRQISLAGQDAGGRQIPFAGQNAGGKPARERAEERSAAQNPAEDFMDFEEKVPKKKEPRKQEGSRTGRLFLVICFCVAAALLAAAAWFWKLTVTQIGGIAFLLVAILIYGCTMDSRQKKSKKEKADKKSRRVLENFEEEEWPEEPVSAAPQYRQAARVGERMRYGTGAQGAGSGVPEAPRAHNMQGRAANDGRENGRAGTWYGARAADDGRENGRAGTWYGAHAADDGRASERRLGDTGVLVEGVDNESHLILVSTNPQKRDSIVLEKDSYVIGKLPTQADLVLEHPSVSRVHAKLDRLGNDYYLCDLNSTNGTFVNGRRLMVNESVKLNPSDEIAFARVGFQVVKY